MSVIAGQLRAGGWSTFCPVCLGDPLRAPHRDCPNVGLCTSVTGITCVCGTIWSLGEFKRPPADLSHSRSDLP